MNLASSLHPAEAATAVRTVSSKEANSHKETCSKETKKIFLKMVAGQVAATNSEFAGTAGFPTEASLAKEVKSMPGVVSGKSIGAGTPVEVNSEAGQVVKLSISHGKWKFLSMTDTFSVADAAGEAFAGGVYIKEFSSVIGKARLVVYSADDKPICLAVQEVVTANKKYDIYGLQPLLDGDKATEKEGGIDFYPWFKVRDIDDCHLDYRSFLVWNGKNFMPLMHIVPVKRTHDNAGLAELLPPKKGDNMVVDKDDPSKIYALMKKTGDRRVAGWDVCVAPGTDVLASKYRGRILHFLQRYEKKTHTHTLFLSRFANSDHSRCHYGRHGRMVRLDRERKSCDCILYTLV